MTKAQAEMRRVSQERIAKAQADTLAVVQSGVCPQCGGKPKRNMSIRGWWQCEQLGAVGFRKDPNRPSCDWQGFTA